VAEGRLKVVIAGAGVAGLEALLALHELAPDRVELTLLAPTDRFVYRPMLVAEPFGIGAAIEIELGPIVEHTGAQHLNDSLISVDPHGGTVATGSGSTLSYDALLVASGARPVDAVPGALSFAGKEERDRFGVVLTELGRRGVKRLAFVVPPRVTWSIAAYELALLTAGERKVRELSGVELLLVTHEAAPLGPFGTPATQLVTARLEEADIDLRLSSAVEIFDGSELRLAGGEPISVDRVVALPGLEVPELPGLPQREHGFVTTDVRMHVAGLERVWAAGDVTSFPIKQGGLAAQQADVAARSIAAHAGVRAPVQPFQPVLRAALITGGAPEYMRTALFAGAGTEAAVGQALWQPAVKLAGNYLAPYLSHAGEEPGKSAKLIDVAADPETAGDEGEHEQAMALVLAAADADAEGGDFEGALRWLAVAEQLEFVLPQEYITRRDQWLRELDPNLEPSAAAARIDPALIDAAAAISDLQRRLGWLREIDARTEAEMRGELAHLDEGMAQLIALSRRTGNLPRPKVERRPSGRG
jgi:sulfide:quinone oxidoreductase